MMVHIVSHFGSGDFGPCREVICTMRMAENKIHTSPEQNSTPTPIFRLRGICRGMTSRSGKNMTVRSVSAVKTFLRKARLTHKICQNIHCKSIVHASCLMTNFLWREAHYAFVEQFLGVVASNGRACNEAANVCLSIVNWYSRTLR